MYSGTIITAERGITTINQDFRDILHLQINNQLTMNSINNKIWRVPRHNCTKTDNPLTDTLDTPWRCHF